MTKNKILFLIIFFSCFFFINQAEASQYCACNGVASFTCHLDENVASGDTVNCSIADDNYWCEDCPGDGLPCDSAVGGGSCTIYGGSNQCTINNIDCGCTPNTSPYFNVWTSVNNGSLSFIRYRGICNPMPYPAINGYYNGYYWVNLSNPYNCTINFNYTPPSAGSCLDSCNGYQLVDNNGDCINNSICGTSSTRYTGGECTICPLNNNSCSSKYPGNTQTSGNCVVAGGNMWSNGDFTVSHNVSFSNYSGTLTIYGKIIMNGGTINLAGLAGGYILIQN